MSSISDQSSAGTVGAWWKSALGIVTILALVLGALWVAQNRHGASGEVSAITLEDSSDKPPTVGSAAPAFEAETVAGDNVLVPGTNSLPTWLVFNATWCSNCRAEMPDIETVFREYSDRVDFVSVFVGDSASAVADYGEKLNLTFPQVPDPQSEIGSLYRTLGVPAHYFLDKDGNVVSLYVGALSETGMRERLEQILVSSN